MHLTNAALYNNIVLYTGADMEKLKYLLGGLYPPLREGICIICLELGFLTLQLRYESGGLAELWMMESASRNGIWTVGNDGCQTVVPSCFPFSLFPVVTVTASTGRDSLSISSYFDCLNYEIKSWCGWRKKNLNSVLISAK